MELNKMYLEVFKDCVNNYLENMEEEDKVKLTNEDIEDIAYKLVHKNEHVWEVINETIDMYIGNIIIKRGQENE